MHLLSFKECPGNSLVFDVFLGGKRVFSGSISNALIIICYIKFYYNERDRQNLFQRTENDAFRITDDIISKSNSEAVHEIDRNVFVVLTELENYEYNLSVSTSSPAQEENPLANLDPSDSQADAKNPNSGTAPPRGRAIKYGMD